MDQSEPLTVTDAAIRLDRSTEQVRRYLREGRLPGRRIGGQWFIEPTALEDFAATSREDLSFLDRLPLAAECHPLDHVIALAGGGGSNLVEGKDAYRAIFRWRR